MTTETKTRKRFRRVTHGQENTKQKPIRKRLINSTTKAEKQQSNKTLPYWDKKASPMTDDYIKALRRLGYEFKFNEMTDAIEVNEKRLTDPLMATIRSEMRDLGYSSVTVMEDAYTAYAYKNRHHPVRNYLNSLKWDGKSHIENFARYVEDKDNIFYSWFRKWLIGTVNKVFTGQQNPMLVLEGNQDLGKSYLVRWLCPLSDYFIESPINPDNKDDQIRLTSNFIWEVGELGSTTRRTDREALKFFLTLEKVTARRPYDRNDTEKPAMASFIGTINDEGAGFLSDPTGNRRFLILNVR